MFHAKRSNIHKLCYFRHLFIVRNRKAKLSEQFKYPIEKTDVSNTTSPGLVYGPQLKVAGII